MQTEKPSDPKPIQALLCGSTVGAIVKKAQLLNKIERSLSTLLAKEMARCTHVLNLKESCLILTSNNSAIATRIRYREDELLIKLNRMADLPEITRIECVVRP